MTEIQRMMVGGLLGLVVGSVYSYFFTKWAIRHLDKD